MTPGRLVLLDSASLYFRAFFGVPDRREDESSLPTNAVRGFLDMVATIVENRRPTHLVACWDNDWRPQFRVAAIPTYKTHRLVDGSDLEEQVPDDLAVQVPVIREVLELAGIPRLGADGFEADDVIGTLVHRHKGVLPVDVVTGDRDLFQLVDDAAGVRVVYTAKGGVRSAEVVDEAFLQDRYAVPSGSAYADLAVLRGDPSDGLPGVPGIGEKTAARLLAVHGDLAGLRKALADGDPRIRGAQRARLEAASDYLDVAPDVVRVAPDAPVPEVDLSLPTALRDPERLGRLAGELAIAGPVHRLLTALRLV